MKVLIVNDFGPLSGGAERASVVLRCGLRALGHDARLFTSTARPVADENPADYTSFGSEALRRVLQVANPWAAIGLRRVLSDFQPDVIHVRMFLTQLSPLVLRELRAFPALLHLNNFQTVCPLNTRTVPDGSACTVIAGKPCLDAGCVSTLGFARTTVQLGAWRRWRSVFQLLIANSQGLADELASAGLRVDDVIWNGAAARSARPPLDGPPTVAYAGRLVKKKGVDILLRAMSLLSQTNTDARLLIAGDGPCRRSIEALIDELGLQDRVTLLGHVLSSDLERRLAGAWVLAVPSIYQEPFANTAVEAMMRGSAVVASAVGGMPEIVREGHTGLMVPLGDASALAHALGRVLTDRAFAERLGANGRAVALAEFTEERVAERFAAVYERMTANHRNYSSRN